MSYAYFIHQRHINFNFSKIKENMPPKLRQLIKSHYLQTSGQCFNLTSLIFHMIMIRDAHIIISCNNHVKIALMGFGGNIQDMFYAD